MSIAILIFSLFGMLLLGMPIAFAISLSSLFFLIYVGNIPLQIIPHLLGNSLDSYNVIAIPFFILAAQVMNKGGVTDRMMNFASVIVGHLKGGLAHVNILTSMLFAGMSGSAVADSAGLGQILIPAMKKKGYGAAYSAAVTAASSTIGPIIPPSVPIVIYGILAEASIGKLFLAGALPGLVMGLAMIGLSYVIAVRKNYPSEDAPTLKQIVKSALKATPALLTPVIILGGMWGGIFSPTEAAGVAAGYAILQGFAMRDLTFRGLWECIVDSAIYSSVIMIIVATATLFGWILSTEQIPVRLADFMINFTANKYVILIIINIFLLIFGCFMEILAIMLMTVPVILPLIQQIGIDPIHFGVVMVLNLMIGLLSPPFGLCLYIAQDIAGISYLEAVKAIVPYILLIITVLLIATYLPEFVMFIPNLFS